ncbi:MAG: molybdopterin-guanine dinucleotide biosynthesis protein B [Chloroflexota bacterium]
MRQAIQAPAPTRQRLPQPFPQEPAVVAVVGYSDSGKTTIASDLTLSLKTRGYRVAAVKHCPHGHDMDHTGSDTERLFSAGADAVAAVSPGKISVIRRTGQEGELQEAVDALGPSCDIVIVEGFKESGCPKILACGRGPVSPMPSNVIATFGGEPVDGLPWFQPHEIYGLTDLVEREVMGGRESDLEATLHVDGAEVRLKDFPRAALRQVVLGFVSSLRGVPDHPSAVDVRVRSHTMGARHEKDGPVGEGDM